MFSVNIINEEDLETEFQKAAELFKNCELEAAHPLLVKLSEQGYAQANEKGYHAGDLIASMQCTR